RLHRHPREHAARDPVPSRRKIHPRADRGPDLSVPRSAGGTRYPRGGIGTARVRLEVAFSRHCEPKGRANARPMTGSAKQSIAPQEERMDCFVAWLLAMTNFGADLSGTLDTTGRCFFIRFAIPDMLRSR